MGLAQRAPINRNEIIKTVTTQSEVKIGASSDGSDKNMFTVTMVLRANGEIEVYSDYELTEQGKPRKPNLFCVDIVADTEHIYLKYLKLDTDQSAP